MDIEFEAPPEETPALVLGKKKKKKKKSKESDANDVPVANGSNHEDDSVAVAELVLEKKKKKKKKPAVVPEDGNKADIPHEAALAGSAFATLLGAESGDAGPEVSHDDEDIVASAQASVEQKFSALDLDEVDDIAPVSKKKKKKKKKEAEPGDGNADALLAEGDTLPPGVEEVQARRPLTAAEKKKAKKEREQAAKKKKAAEEEDIHAILAGLDAAPAPSQESLTEESTVPVADKGNDIDDLLGELDAAPVKSSQKKKGKKKKKAAINDDAEDIDALLTELGGPSIPAKAEMSSTAAAPETAADDGNVDDLLAELGDGDGGTKMTAAQKKKAKKKKKAAANAGGDDIDALLNELGGDSSTAKLETPSAPAPEATADDGNVDDLLAELGDDDGGTKMTAAQKKKAKKKKKGAAAKSGASAEASNDAAAGEAVDAKKGKKKKESVAVRKMREQREKQVAAEEALRKAQEEEEARIAEEERLKQEAEQKKADERARKKAAENARKERRRAEGTLLSKAEKERRRKAEIFREQLRAQGLVPPAAAAGPSGAPGGGGDQNRRGFGNRRRKRNVPGPDSPTAETRTTEAGAAPEGPTTASTAVQEEPVVVEEKVLEAWDAVPDNWEKEEEPLVEAKEDEHHVESGPAKAEDAEAEDDDSGESGEDTSSDEDSDDSNEHEGMSDAAFAAEMRRNAIRAAHEKRRKANLAARSPDHLRSPIICILGHVDTGKTKILDRIRRTNVQDGEAGGITQQIGATYFPIDAVKKETVKLPEGDSLSYNVPSLLIIDTPGHESFTNLRTRGSSLCDLAILVIDIMHGIEPQTRESIGLLRNRKTPFIVALNKIDRMFDWHAQPNNCPTRESLSKQKKHSRQEFLTRVKETKLQLNEEGFNSELYWENDDIRKNISLVPTSAITGEGIPDLLMLLLSLPQQLLTTRLMFNATVEATVLEVKVISGLGTTIDIVLTGGTIHEGDTIMVVGLDGPITTTIRALLTPHPMKEMRVKGQYLRHSEIKAAQGIKISAEGLEKAVAGTQIVMVADPDDEDELEYAREEVMKDFSTILQRVDKSGVGVYVQASTLGSLEALLAFLESSKIPVSGINIGPVHKKDIKKASAMLERRKEFATVLAFDVKVEAEARELAEEVGVTIFTADIIYHLFDQFTAYMEDVKRMRREGVSDEVVFPCICRILPQHIYNKKDPIVLGVDVMNGILRVGTPLVVRHGDSWLDVGRVASIEANQKQVKIARKGESVCIKIQHKNTEHIMYGRHFDFQDELVSKMSRRAIDLLKADFRDDLEKEDWLLVVRMKKMFNIL